MRRAIIILLALLPLYLWGQTSKVNGTYTYYASPTLSVKQAMEAAVENAKLQALAKEFGTTLVQNTLSQAEQSGSKEQEFFSQLSTEEVKGEWIEDLQKPETKITATMDDGTLVIEAKVWGRARAISNKSVDFEALTLRNQAEKRFVAKEFIEGDQLYLYFTAPVDGYVAAYLLDESKTAYCMLPYEHDTDGQQPVKHGQEYIFFSPSHPYDLSKNDIDEYQLSCGDENMESNLLYVLFSPNPFNKAIDRKTADKATIDGELLDMPRRTDYEDFQKWMGKLCARDKELTRRILRIIIRRK